MDWKDLTKKLYILRKGGWSWSVGHSNGEFYARLWKYKGGHLSSRTCGTCGHSRSIQKGRYVVSESGNSPENALTKLLSRHGSGNFDPDPVGGLPQPKPQGKPKEGRSCEPDKPHPPDTSLPGEQEA